MDLRRVAQAMVVLVTTGTALATWARPPAMVTKPTSKSDQIR